MIKEEGSIDEVIEAQRQGHKYIKVYLNRNMIQRNQDQIIISGVVSLISSKRGSGMGGMPELDFHTRGGENLVFRFSRDEREYVAWMYDDQGPGYFSPIGYNRDVLASHLEDNFFIVKDEKIIADVEERYRFLKNNPGKKNKNYKIPTLATNASSVEEIDAQIEMLMKKKQQVISLDNAGEQKELNDDGNRILVDTKKSLPPIQKPRKNLTEDEKREENNRKQREYRIRKAAEKKEKLKQLENA